MRNGLLRDGRKEILLEKPLKILKSVTVTVYNLIFISNAAYNTIPKGRSGTHTVL